MSFIDLTRSIERQRFFDGQRLFAEDLQQIEGFNREMRWLHNQSLHQPGIGNGFAVTGRKGDREVVAGAGYAIDDLGREIVLTTSRTLPVPPVAGDSTGQARRFVLTIAYPGDADLEEVELRQGICDTRGAVRLREEPIFCWAALNPDGSPAEDAAEILSGRRTVLAEIAVRDCKLDRDLGIVQRRNARPTGMPRIACGVATPTAWTEWNPWEKDADIALPLRDRRLYRLVGGVQADIPTGAGGFLATPGYLARIDGPRRMTAIRKPDGEVVEAAEELPLEAVVLDGQLSITDAGPAGFVAQVLVLRFDTGSTDQSPPKEILVPDDELDLLAMLTAWQVGWLGFEG
ncbi:hypothetical protein GCM10010112_12780 [Actinoplanes lobatus]|uniref:Uncharacterized protein n=1 Tax=Actinoplanes lobatus TaxID=113568 RepID=A0A7W7HMC8_9ACTN|nr:hypothetical protein [Actinoplanes lobatus]MBB4753116.1 hypothetical protein [Actinoplanes lobatus]GGN58755.1 hypothetical protein GCM10010112_12780 [Actinoplanes lobatus]GIE43024.1 hypothetical protein Alo02nite_59220 [Actinoplanes lobatus]